MNSREHINVDLHTLLYFEITTREVYVIQFILLLEGC